MRGDRRSDAIRLADITTAIRRIREFTRRGQSAFVDSQLVQDAVVRNLEIVGEAAGKISEVVRRAHPEIPWKAMRGFASFAKHEYWKIDVPRLWIAVQLLPSLESKISRIRVDVGGRQ